jgi:hypothetical protein
MLTRDGRTFWLEDVVAFDRLSDGGLMVRGVLVDVTDRKRQEELTAEQERFIQTFCCTNGARRIEAQTGRISGRHSQ